MKKDNVRQDKITQRQLRTSVASAQLPAGMYVLTAYHKKTGGGAVITNC